MTSLTHLLTEDLLDACGTSVAGPDGFHHFTPVHEHVTCPRCLELIPAVIEQAHAEAILEDIAHDAAMTKAVLLTTDILNRWADSIPARLPQSLRTRGQLARSRACLPPGARA